MWAFTYGLVGAAPPGTPLVYFAFGNYATLGYGDLIPVDQWRLPALLLLPGYRLLASITSLRMLSSIA